MYTRSRSLLVGVVFLAVGTSLLAGGCYLGDLGQIVGKFNPCGTILACDPVQYRFLTSGYDGPGADPEIDPACTYPPFCAGDPFVQTIATGP